MSFEIYYFSGTGNSLAVARNLEGLLNDKGSILPLSIYSDREQIEIDTEILGLVFPVYFETVPDVVKSFVRRLGFKTKPYIFAIATCNTSPGHSLFTLNKLFNAKGQSLSSGFVINMPGNALITPPEIEMERLKNSKRKIELVVNQINNRLTNEFQGENNLKVHIRSAIIGAFGKKLISPKKISEAKCTGCGICERVCPMKNIKRIDNKALLGNNCTACLACFHWCPQKAIKINNSLTKRRRYHHPDVTVNDMDLNIDKPVGNHT